MGSDRETISDEQLLLREPLTSVSTRTFAVSSTATTCSRVTVGKPSKKSSIVSPASRYSKRVWTGTRVPPNTGVPPMISGEIVIKLLLIYESVLVKGLSGKRGVIAVGRPVARAAPHTDPGVLFSSTGLFRNTRFRVRHRQRKTGAVIRDGCAEGSVAAAHGND